MQEKREKIRYLDNIRYMFQNWAKWNSKSFLYLVVWVPALIVVPMLGAYVPKAMIDSIEAGVSIPQLVLKITLISGGIAAASWIGPFMEQKMQGVAVLYVGEDLDVLLELADRILVLCGGRVSGIVDARTATKDEIGLLMTEYRTKEAEDE